MRTCDTAAMLRSAVCTTLDLAPLRAQVRVMKMRGYKSHPHRSQQLTLSLLLLCANGLLYDIFFHCSLQGIIGILIHVCNFPERTFRTVVLRVSALSMIAPTIASFMRSNIVVEKQKGNILVLLFPSQARLSCAWSGKIRTTHRQEIQFNRLHTEDSLR